MTKTIKLLLCGLALSVFTGIFSALIRAEVVFSSASPAFYIFFAFALIIIGTVSYFISIESKSSGRENLYLNSSPDNGQKSAASHTTPITVLLLSGAALTAIAAIRCMITASSTTLGKVNFVFVLLCAAAFVIRAFNKEQSEKTGIFSLFPIYYLCFYLLIFYKDNAKGADLNSFAPQALGIAVLIFAAYFNAAVKFDFRPPMLRYMTAMLSLFLFVSDAVAYIIVQSSLISVDPAFYLTLTGGFTIYFNVSLFTIPLKLYKISKHDKKRN